MSFKTENLVNNFRESARKSVMIMNKFYGLKLPLPPPTKKPFSRQPPPPQKANKWKIIGTRSNWYICSHLFVARCCVKYITIANFSNLCQSLSLSLSSLDCTKCIYIKKNEYILDDPQGFDTKSGRIGMPVSVIHCVRRKPKAFTSIMENNRFYTRDNNAW